MNKKFLLWGAIGCGIILQTCVLVIAVILLMPSDDESCVQFANNLEPHARQYLEKHKILQGAEKLVAYYDDTILLDGSEVTILTSKRLISRKNGNSTEMKLADIKNVNFSKEIWDDVFLVTGKSGQTMKISIAKWQGGEAFGKALDGVRNSTQKIEK